MADIKFWEEMNQALFVNGDDKLMIGKPNGATQYADVHQLNAILADGRGITDISLSSSDGLVDTYTITYTDDTTSTFDVTNGSNAQSFNFKGNVSNYAGLPSSGNEQNDAWYNLDDEKLYVYNGSEWPDEDTGISFGGEMEWGGIDGDIQDQHDLINAILDSVEAYGLGAGIANNPVYTGDLLEINQTTFLRVGAADNRPILANGYVRCYHRGGNNKHLEFVSDSNRVFVNTSNSGVWSGWKELGEGSGGDQNKWTTVAFLGDGDDTFFLPSIDGIDFGCRMEDEEGITRYIVIRMSSGQPSTQMTISSNSAFTVEPVGEGDIYFINHYDISQNITTATNGFEVPFIRYPSEVEGTLGHNSTIVFVTVNATGQTYKVECSFTDTYRAMLSVEKYTANVSPIYEGGA